MVTKDNLIFGLAGVILGIIAGALLVSFSRAPGHATTPMITQQAPAPEQQPSSSATSQQLPEGHPPIDQETVKQQIAEQEEILKKDPENQQATIALANLHFDSKDYQQAAKLYEKALQKEPSNVNLITDLGTAYLWMNETQKALDLYDKSLSIDPTHMQTLMNLGIARMSLGDRQGAAAAWEKVLALYPNNPEAAMLRQAVEKLRSTQQGS